MADVDFDTAFRALTGNPPFPWQRTLYYEWFAAGKFPEACTLPTGLGKTSVVAVWLIALANGKAVLRRLVYVVNRRTVVDQTTDEVEKYRERLGTAGIADQLRKLCALPLPKDDTPALALSTLRGQFADNREWSADPARPAVICGTVDMIGSRLLFAGYGIGFKSRPLHAGFLGQHTLLVHDEAHLEPAFQKLLTAVVNEQARCHDSRRMRVMELTATSRGDGEVFRLTPGDFAERDRRSADHTPRSDCSFTRRTTRNSRRRSRNSHWPTRSPERRCWSSLERSRSSRSSRPPRKIELSPVEQH